MSPLPLSPYTYGNVAAMGGAAAPAGTPVLNQDNAAVLNQDEQPVLVAE